MPNNHRGMPIADNYRPTPRIAQMLTTWVNKTSGLEPGDKPYTTADARAYITEYRDVRDFPRNDESANVASAMKAPIADVVKRRKDLAD